MSTLQQAQAQAQAVHDQAQLQGQLQGHAHAHAHAQAQTQTQAPQPQAHMQQLHPQPQAQAPISISQEPIMFSDSNNNNSEVENREGPTKRRAMKGQWQTPPVGEMFPSSTSAPVSNASASANNGNANANANAAAQSTSTGAVNIPLNNLHVPSTSDDYAKALQEAYRRGAEAAAAMSQNRAAAAAAAAATVPGSVKVAHAPVQTPIAAAQTAQPAQAQSQQTQSNVHAAPIQHHSQQTAQHPAAIASTAAASASASTNMGVQNPLRFLSANSLESAAANTTNTGTTTTHRHTMMNPQGQAQIQTQAQAQTQQMATNVGVGVGVGAVAMNVEPTPVMPEPVTSNVQPLGIGTAAGVVPQAMNMNVNLHANTHAHAALNSVALNDNSVSLSGQRSLSMPNMNNLKAGDGNDEEAKRLKRLARNRASARLRRLRKKNLVESYESEVGVLETSLAKLQAHKWGVGNNTDALIEALSMDRGQQKIDSEKRKELITSTLAQQREQVRNLMDCQLENMTLAWIAHQGEEGAGSDNIGLFKNTDGEDPTTTAEVNELASELNEVLGLTPDQKKQLRSSTAGIEEERKSIEVINQSLTALMSNSWLMNNGIEECTEQFTNILNPTQMSKFLLWSDHNSEAIDQLDYVNAPPSNAPPSSSPTFMFGIEESNAGDEGA